MNTDNPGTPATTREERSKVMADTRKMLITGATGNVGSSLLNHLDMSDVNLRVLTHDESKAKALRDRGI